MFPQNHGVIALPVTSCIKDTCSNLSNRIREWRRIVRSCDRHSNETVTLRNHSTKYKNMRKWMVEFLRKFENRGIKIARVNSIHIAKSINLPLFALILYGVGGPL